MNPSSNYSTYAVTKKNCPTLRIIRVPPIVKTVGNVKVIGVLIIIVVGILLPISIVLVVIINMLCSATTKTHFPINSRMFYTIR